MQYGTALPLQLRNKFSEGSKLAPMRDNRNNSLLWKKAQRDSRQQYATVDMLQKTAREIGKMRRRIVGGGLPAPAQQTIFPFVIYNIPNVSATDGQKSQFTAQGVDINSLTFQIRDGLVGCRPYINTPTTSQLDPIENPVGNCELIVPVTTTDSAPISAGYSITDFYYPLVSNKGTTIVLDDTLKTLICGIPSGSPIHTPAVLNHQVALNPMPTQGAGIANPQRRVAAFWLEIVDDPLNGIYVNLWGQMASGETNSTRSVNPIPQASNVIPLGWVDVQSPDSSIAFSIVGCSVYQITTGNVVNRFPAGFTTMRGRWNSMFAALPAGSLYLTFYPGDIVVDDAASNPVNVADGGPVVGTWNAYYSYILGGTAPVVLQVGANPGSDATNWTQIGLMQAP